MKRKSLGMPILVGVPFDGQSSYLRGAGVVVDSWAI